MGVGDFGTIALNSLRLEKGFRGWGAEMSIDQNPYEAGLGFFVKTKKMADFVGKDALIALKEAGSPRTLVFLYVDVDDVDPEGNESIWHDGKVVGMTTSGSYGNTVKQSMAFAYVPNALAAPGTQVQVELLGKKHVATVQTGAPIMIESARVAAAEKEAQKATAGV